MTWLHLPLRFLLLFLPQGLLLLLLLSWLSRFLPFSSPQPFFACLTSSAAPLQLPAEHLWVTWSQTQQVLDRLYQESTLRRHGCTWGFVVKLALHFVELKVCYCCKKKKTKQHFFGSTSLAKSFSCYSRLIASAPMVV